MDTSDKDRNNPSYTQVSQDGPYLFSYELTSYNINNGVGSGFTTIVDNVTTHSTYTFKSARVRSPASKMMGVEPVASIVTSPSDAPPIDTTWVVQCGRWEPFNTGITALNNYLSMRHNKKSSAVFADGHVEAVGQDYATNQMYSNPTY
jgi:prepilin-type processing-associated H-X9-DG protein